MCVTVWFEELLLNLDQKKANFNSKSVKGRRKTKGKGSFFPPNQSVQTAEWNNIAGVSESSVSYHWKKTKQTKSLNRKMWRARLFLQSSVRLLSLRREGKWFQQPQLGLVLIILTIKLKFWNKPKLNVKKRRRKKMRGLRDFRWSALNRPFPPMQQP